MERIISYYASMEKDIPVGKGLFIKPIRVRDYYTFINCQEVLFFNKNEIADIKIIQMSYFQFLLSYVRNMRRQLMGMKAGDLYMQKFGTLLELTTGIPIENISVTKDGDLWYLMLGDIKMDDELFNDWKNMVLLANIKDYDLGEKYEDPDYKRDKEEYYKIKNKGLIAPNLEKRIRAVMLMTGMTKSDILDMTYRDFEEILSLGMKKIDYSIQMQAAMSGMVKFEQTPEHWLYSREKTLSDFGMVDFDDFTKKVTI